MKIFVAGATGALGRVLVPQLVAGGHDVVGMTRSASKQDLVRSLGARPVVADALDPDAVASAVAAAEPEVIVHQLTALSGPVSAREMRHPDRSSAAIMTNRLRTEATDHLLAAGQAVGARRFVAQSFGAFRFARNGGPVLTEADPLHADDPPAPLQSVQAGYLYLEKAVTSIEWGAGLALRYGGFYGPGNLDQPGAGRPDGSARSQAAVPDRRRRRWRHCRTSTSKTPRRRPSPPSSAARPASTTSSTTTPRPRASGCPCWRTRWRRSRRGASRAGSRRLAAGEAATAMMTETKGASNEKAKRELGWSPRYPSWRQGFRDGLAMYAR